MSEFTPILLMEASDAPSFDLRSYKISPFIFRDIKQTLEAQEPPRELVAAAKAIKRFHIFFSP